MQVYYVNYWVERDYGRVKYPSKVEYIVGESHNICDITIDKIKSEFNMLNLKEYSPSALYALPKDEYDEYMHKESVCATIISCQNDKNDKDSGYIIEEYDLEMYKFNTIIRRYEIIVKMDNGKCEVVRRRFELSDYEKDAGTKIKSFDVVNIKGDSSLYKYLVADTGKEIANYKDEEMFENYCTLIPRGTTDVIKVHESELIKIGERRINNGNV